MKRWEKLLDALLPDTCVLCAQQQPTRQAHLLCQFCWAALPRNTQSCAHCAIPMRASGVCADCRMRPRKPPVCLAPLLHQREARYLVHQLKYFDGFRAGRTLAIVLLDAIERAYRDAELPECLIPVPLSARRRLTRGYNQAAWLTHGLNRSLGLPVLHGPVVRRHGPAQQTLSRRARATLAAGTFALRGELPYEHVAIVDDVMTTGATTRVLANLLIRRGAARVDVWCATRAVPD